VRIFAMKMSSTAQRPPSLKRRAVGHDVGRSG
jgi:hypothetical protein